MRKKVPMKDAATFAVFLLGSILVSAPPAAAGAPAADEKAVIEKVIRDNIGWALTKNRPLAESTMSRDERLFIFNPDSASTIGWSQLVKNFDFWMDPRFKATKCDIRDLRIDVSRSGDVAWWSCILDDLGEWDGKPTGWKDTRWTGIMEKRDGKWLIVQMHFSFASDKVAAAVKAKLERDKAAVPGGQDGADVFPKLSGPYLGQKPPGMTALLFAPGIVDTGIMERDVVVSPDGREIYFGVACGEIMTIMWTRLQEGRWTEPEVAPFATDRNYLHFEPAMSVDGRRMFFLTNRPVKGQTPAPGWAHQNIWAADRTADGSWGEPYDPDPAINNGGQQFYPSLTRDGTLYFTRMGGQPGKAAIYRARLAGGKYAEAEKLPDKINGTGTPYNAFVAPDESYLIVCVAGRPCDINPGQANYFIFFRDKNDNWNDGVPLGPEVNMKGSTAMSCSVSPDGRYFFFAAVKTAERFAGSLKGMTLRRLLEMNGSVQNGNFDIYWIDAGVIEKLRPKA